jgi:hypothetical protein
MKKLHLWTSYTPYGIRIQSIRVRVRVRVRSLKGAMCNKESGNNENTEPDKNRTTKVCNM